MGQDDFEIEEYRSLRNSIDMHMKLIPEIFAIMVAATSALLGYGVNTQIFVVFLFPLFIIIPLAWLILSQMEEVMLKGTYIKKHYEGNIIGWELTLFECRKIREEGKKWCFAKAAGDAQAFVITIIFLILICLLGFVFPWNHTYFYSYLNGFFGYIIILVFIIIWIGAAWFTYKVSIRMLNAYTSEKEEGISKHLDKVFKSVEESTPPRQD